MAGDGQCTLGETVCKGNSRKVRKIYDGKILTGFAGSVADAFTLLDRFEAKVKEYNGDMSLICACNGSYYGGGFHPVPEARPDDAVLDFLIVKGVSRAGFIRLVGGYANGKYADMEKVITHIRGSRIDIESDTELAVNVDGELIFAKKVCMQLVPGGVNFLVPKGMDFFHTAAPVKA